MYQPCVSTAGGEAMHKPERLGLRIIRGNRYEVVTLTHFVSAPIDAASLKWGRSLICAKMIGSGHEMFVRYFCIYFNTQSRLLRHHKRIILQERFV